MTRSTQLHGSRSETTGRWLYRRGWTGHARLELARRRRRSKAARLARRRNR